MLQAAVICELLDTLDIAFCEFDDELCAVRWNATFYEFFPEHAGYIHHGEHYSENLRRFYNYRLNEAELPDIERLVAEGLARHLQQQQPFEFTHRGRKLRVSSLPIPGAGRVRIWKELGDAQAEQRSPEIPPFDALDFIADGACVADPQGVILASNNQFRELYDVPGDRVIVGQTFEKVLADAWHGVSPVSSLTAMITNRLRYDNAPFEVELPRDRWRRVITRHSAGGFAYTTHGDITDAKRQHRELLAAKEDLNRANAELRMLSRQDPLTNLPNRRAFASEFASASGDACVLMIDVDHFKAINDSHGHGVGDACLRRIAAIIDAKARARDGLPARVGGEEFAVILPNSDVATAKRLAEEIRMEVAHFDWPSIYPAIERVTVSIGVGTSDGKQGAEQEAADRALYRAKASGRNKVEVEMATSSRRSA